MAVRLIKCEEQNDVLFKKIVVGDYSSSTAIIVPDTHNAIIIKDGIAFDTLSSGKHYIFDKKQSQFAKEIGNAESIEIIFISKTAKLNIYWGTTTQWEMRDPVTNVSIKLVASGEFEVQISNPRKAYLELIGSQEVFDTEKLKNRLQGRLLAEVQFQIANIMNDKKLSYDRLGEVLLPISKELLPHVKKMFESDYGLKIFSFTISRIIITDEDIKKISDAKNEQAKYERGMKEAQNKAKMDEINFNRELDLRRLQVEDYAKYLEVCRVIGWPADKKKGATGDDKECPNCGAKITKEVKFCSVCGYELLKQKEKCPNCSKLVNKGDMFCKHCGAKIGG